MTREEAIKYLKSADTTVGKKIKTRTAEAIEMAIKALEQQYCEDMGEVSDGYHTFNQLYHQRAILFATIVNQNVDKSWKSFKHEDGKYCFDRNGEWFIVGVDTPEGSYTYHYEKKYWNYFKCKELETAKHWDGHTEEDVTRLLSLEQEPCEDCISRTEAINKLREHYFDKELQSAKNDPCVIDAMTDLDIRIIKALPHVTPQPKIGHWERVGARVDLVECTSCGYRIDVKPYTYPIGKCCHNCGARMRKEKTDVQ